MVILIPKSFSLPEVVILLVSTMNEELRLADSNLKVSISLVFSNSGDSNLKTRSRNQNQSEVLIFGVDQKDCSLYVKNVCLVSTSLGLQTSAVVTFSQVSVSGTIQ